MTDDMPHATPDVGDAELIEQVAAKFNAFVASPDSRQRERLYDAQELWELSLVERDALPDDIPEGTEPEQLSRLAVEALNRAGWSITDAPVFVLDVPDEDVLERAGWHDRETGVIHMWPRSLSFTTFLHELAHWVDDRGGHGPEFCASLVTLVRANMSDDAADELLSCMREHGVEVDPGRLAP